MLTQKNAWGGGDTHTKVYNFFSTHSLPTYATLMSIYIGNNKDMKSFNSNLSNNTGTMYSFF